MIFFEIYKQLDYRMYRTVKEMDSSINVCSRYIIDGDSFYVLGTNISSKWNMYDKSVEPAYPLKHWDMVGETLYWFSEESTEGAVVRMINNAFRQWHGIAPFGSFSEFEQSEADINRKLGEYGLRIVWDLDRMAVLRNDDIITFEMALAQIMEDDALKEAGMSIDEWLYDARYFRQTDQLERAVEQYERVIRYSNNSMRVYTESAFCLAESYYFLGDYERAVNMYYKCNLDFIEDETDFFIHIGHALLDVKMKNYEKDLKVYYRGCLDQSYAMNHVREIERAASAVAEEFESYEKSCLMVGQKKYEEHMNSLPMHSDAIDEMIVMEADKRDYVEQAKNRYLDVRLVTPSYLSNVDNISLSALMSEALELFRNGEYQRAYEVYYRLAESLDPESDYATWVYFQLGKLYCICNDPVSAFEALKRCKLGKFGVVYRQTDFFILYTHVKIMCDDFESDQRFRKLIRGKYDNYYAKYDPEYIKLIKNQKIMNTFKRYEKECLNAAKEDFAHYFDEMSGTRRRSSNRDMGLFRGVSKYFSE